MWLELACPLSAAWRQTEEHANTLIQTCHPHGYWPCLLAGRMSRVGEGAHAEETWRWTPDESGSNEKKDGGRLKREWRGRRRGGGEREMGEVLPDLSITRKVDLPVRPLVN